MKHKNTIQACGTTIPHRLAIQTQLQNRAKESPGICITTIETYMCIPDCMVAEEIGIAMLDDEYIDMLS